MTSIVALRAENFKRLKAVEIQADGKSVVIGGRNAQGKSSVLDAIQAAIAGKKGVKDISRPIRDGEKKASVVLELDDLVVERTWTAAGTKLKVSPRGANATLGSPQAVLDKLMGSLSFDPLEFAEAEPKKQVETLIDLIGRKEFDRIAQQRREVYDQRTDANRNAKRHRAQLDGLGQVEPVEKVDVAETMALLEQVSRKVDLRARWQQIQTKIEELQAEQAKIAEEAATLPDGDPQALREAIADAAATNEMAAKHQQARALEWEAEQAERLSTECTDRIAQLDQERVQLIAAAQLPVSGLSFDDEGVLFNGVPFTQASAAERLKVSTAMAMALNPELKVICIRDGSLLDEESKAAVHQLAEASGYQLWMEVVGDAGEVGVIIEDGSVVT